MHLYKVLKLIKFKYSGLTQFSMGISHKLHVYFASYFWESKLSVPFYLPMQIYFADVDPKIQDLQSFIKYNIFKKRMITGPTVKSATIIPTFVCNARCNYCVYHYKKIQYDTPFMEFSLFCKAIDDLIDIGIKEINLTPTVGEVLVDKNFFEKVAYAKKKGMKVLFHTNGMLLDCKDNYKKLVDSKIDDLTISLSDLDPKIEARISGVSEAMAKSKIQGIQKLLELNTKEKGIKFLRLHFRQDRNPYYVTREKLFKDFRKNYKFSYAFIFRIDNWGGRLDQKLLSKSMRLRKERKIKAAPCIWLNVVSVHPDGKIRVCGCRILENLNDDLIIGDIADTHLKNVISNGNLEKIKKDFTIKNYPKVCEHCSAYWSE
jgi:MoaA/NifB/PqqE/SkfB family radical SAM enzyme